MAVTISYLWPFTTAPTIAQIVQGGNNLVIATVVTGAAADTSAVITHDFQLSNAEITQGFPRLTLVPQDGNQQTSPWWEASQNPNYTVLQKNTVAVAPNTKVFVSRPTTLER